LNKQYCFEYMDAILSKSGKFTQRNHFLLCRMIATLAGLAKGASDLAGVRGLAPNP